MWERKFNFAVPITSKYYACKSGIINWSSQCKDTPLFIMIILWSFNSVCLRPVMYLYLSMRVPCALRNILISGYVVWCEKTPTVCGCFILGRANIWRGLPNLQVLPSLHGCAWWRWQLCSWLGCNWTWYVVCWLVPFIDHYWMVLSCLRFGSVHLLYICINSRHEHGWSTKSNFNSYLNNYNSKTKQDAGILVTCKSVYIFTHYLGNVSKFQNLKW